MENFRLIRFTAFYALFLLCGAIMVLGFAPFYYYLLPFASLAFLYFGLSKTKNIKQSFFGGLLFGFGLFGVGVAWLYHSLSTYGAMSDFMSIPAIVLFCLAMALYYGIAAALFKFSTRNSQNFLVFTLIFAIADYLRNIVFTGFPFLTLGYTQSFPSLLNAFAPLIGVFGLSLMVLLLSEVLAMVLQNCIIDKNYKKAIFGLLFIIANFGAAYILEKNVSWSQPIKSEFTANLVQMNILPDDKFSEKFQHGFFTWFYDLLEANSTDLLILPETTIVSRPQTIINAFGDDIKNLANQGKFQNIIMGAIGENQQDFYNSAINININININANAENIAVQQYNKRHLVPFGEYVPFGFRWFIEQAKIPLSDFTKGNEQQDFFILRNRRGDEILAALNICYEDAFGYEVGKINNDVGVLINISNMAWFGDSWAMWQHLQMAQMRSAELSRPLLRSTNTGVTAMISPKGEVLRQLPGFTAENLKVKFFAYQGETPYLKYGDKIFYVLILVIFLLLLINKIIIKRDIKRRII